MEQKQDGTGSVSCVVCADAACADRACALAARIGVPCVSEQPTDDALCLVVDAQGCALTAGALTCRCDFADEVRRLRPDSLSRELVVRAARTKRAAGAELPLVVDATAGFGQDSLLLAAAGFRVILFERDPVICALLSDALERGARDPRLADAVARMELRCEDSIQALPALTRAPDVVLLDPMFPARTKSAQVKKKFQLIHRLEGPACDEEALLRAALAAHPRKVVVKRPAKGPHLAGAKPSYAIAGKAVRYDVIVPPRAGGVAD